MTKHSTPTLPSLRCKAHWQNAQSQRYNQILPKSLPAHPTLTHGGQKSAANLIDNEINKQKSPVPNKRYKTLGFKWLCNVSTTHQSLVYLDRNVARTPQRFHTAVRYSQ